LAAKNIFKKSFNFFSKPLFFKKAKEYNPNEKFNRGKRREYI